MNKRWIMTAHCVLATAVLSATGCGFADVAETVEVIEDTLPEYPAGCDYVEISTRSPEPMTTIDAYQFALGEHQKDCSLLGSSPTPKRDFIHQPRCEVKDASFTSASFGGARQVESFNDGIVMLWFLALSKHQRSDSQTLDDITMPETGVFLLRTFGSFFNEPNAEIDLQIGLDSSFYAKRSSCLNRAELTLESEGRFSSDEVEAEAKAQLISAASNEKTGVMFVLYGLHVNPIVELIGKGNRYGRALRLSLFEYYAENFKGVAKIPQLSILKQFRGLISRTGTGQKQNIDIGIELAARASSGEVGAQIDADLGLSRDNLGSSASERVWVEMADKKSALKVEELWHPLPGPKEIADDFAASVRVEVVSTDTVLRSQARTLVQRVIMKGVPQSLCSRVWHVEPMKGEAMILTNAIAEHEPLPETGGSVYHASTDCSLLIQAQINPEIELQELAQLDLFFNLVSELEVFDNQEYHRLRAPVSNSVRIIHEPRIRGIAADARREPSTESQTSDSELFIASWRIELDIADALFPLDYQNQESFRHQEGWTSITCNRVSAGETYKVPVHVSLEVDETEKRLYLIASTVELLREDYNLEGLNRCTLSTPFEFLAPLKNLDERDLLSYKHLPMFMFNPLSR